MLHLYVCTQPLGDALGKTAAKIEYRLWGDARATHSYFVAEAEDNTKTIIELKMNKKKKMRLQVREMGDFKSQTLHIEYLGQTILPLRNILQLAEFYLANHSRYSFFSHNCREFTDFIVNNIPELDTYPRVRSSVLEYCHQKLKNQKHEESYLISYGY
jgi:hypothetical protein